MASEIMGKMVRDKIFGFMGVVIARTEWLYGCVRVTVQSKGLEKGEPVKSQCFDEPQVDIVGEGINAKSTANGNAVPPHGDRDDPDRSDLDVSK